MRDMLHKYIPKYRLVVRIDDSIYEVRSDSRRQTFGADKLLPYRESRSIEVFGIDIPNNVVAIKLSTLDGTKITTQRNAYTLDM